MSDFQSYVRCSGYFCSWAVLISLRYSFCISVQEIEQLLFQQKPFKNVQHLTLFIQNENEQEFTSSLVKYIFMQIVSFIIYEQTNPFKFIIIVMIVQMNKLLSQNDVCVMSYLRNLS